MRCEPTLPQLSTSRGRASACRGPVPAGSGGEACCCSAELDRSAPSWRNPHLSCVLTLRRSRFGTFLNQGRYREIVTEQSELRAPILASSVRFLGARNAGFSKNGVALSEGQVASFGFSWRGIEVRDTG